MANFQNSSFNKGSLSLRPSLSPSFSLPGLTTPSLGIRPETIILIGGGILLLAYLSNRNKGLSDLGQSTTGAVTGVADAIGNTAGLVSDFAGLGRDTVSFARSSASDAFRFGSSVGSSVGSSSGLSDAVSVVSGAAFTPAKAVDSVRTAASVVSGAAFTPAKAVDSVRTAASVVSNAAFTPAKAVDSVRTAASVVSNAAQNAVRSVNDASASLFKRLEKYRNLYILLMPILYCRFKHRVE